MRNGVRLSRSPAVVKVSWADIGYAETTNPYFGVLAHFWNCDDRVEEPDDSDTPSTIPAHPAGCRSAGPVLQLSITTTFLSMPHRVIRSGTR
jgi:hypothetical protein